MLNQTAATNKKMEPSNIVLRTNFLLKLALASVLIVLYSFYMFLSYYYLVNIEGNQQGKDGKVQVQRECSVKGMVQNQQKH